MSWLKKTTTLSPKPSQGRILPPSAFIFCLPLHVLMWMNFFGKEIGKVSQNTILTKCLYECSFPSLISVICVKIDWPLKYVFNMLRQCSSSPTTFSWWRGSSTRGFMPKPCPVTPHKEKHKWFMVSFAQMLVTRALYWSQAWGWDTMASTWWPDLCWGPDKYSLKIESE